MTTSIPNNVPAPALDLEALLASLKLPAIAPQAPAMPSPVRPLILPSPGQQLHSPHTGTNFTVDYQIGEGHFSVVFKGTDDWDNDVAIKVLKPKGTIAEDQAAAEGELERLIALRHGKITQIHDAFFHQGAFYIVTEHCGITLGMHLDYPENIAPHCIQGVGRCVLQALEYIHRNKMVYLDLHVDNVFFYWGRHELNREHLSGFTFKVGDLGITKPEDAISPQVTMAQWMLPPEVLDPTFGSLGRTIDIYHCGLLLLQVALGRRLEFTRQEILDGAPRNLALTLDEPYRTAIEKALRRRVNFRTPTAREFYRDLMGRPS